MVCFLKHQRIRLYANNVKGNHARLHKKDLATYISVVTDIVTVTASDAIIWVNEAGNVISTEYKGVATSTEAPTTSSIPYPISTIVAETTTTHAPTSSPLPSSSVDAPVPEATSSVSVQIPTVDAPLPTSTAEPASESSTSIIPLPATTETPTASEAAESSTVVEPLPVTTSATNPIQKGVNNGSGQQASASGFGIAYDMMQNINACKNVDQMTSDMAYLAGQGYTKVRTYDVGCDNAGFVSAVGKAGMKAMVGTIGYDAPSLNKLISQINGNWGAVDTVYIGNEVVGAGGDPGAVAGAVNAGRGTLRAAGFNGDVVTVDQQAAMANNPQLCAASDYCAVNCHPFFDVTLSPSGAGASVQACISQVAAVSGGKSVVVTETGWPYAGDNLGRATPDNQRTALASIMGAVGGGQMFLFQAYDASYKSPGAFGVEQFFGIYDTGYVVL